MAIRWKGLTLSLLIMLVGLPMTLSAQVISTDKHQVRVIEVVRGLEHPWGIAFLPDGRILVSERPGQLRLIVDGQLQRQPVTGLPTVLAQGQGGLLDVTLHPKFAENRLVYFSYTSVRTDGISVNVARGELTDSRLSQVQEIFRAEPGTRSGRHFGSRLVFDDQGYLFVTLGDHGQKERAQQPDDHAGSIIRLHDDGRIPADNPYREKSQWLKEIYSIGHRNIQGAALHPQTRKLWTHEHGPQGGDEINIVYAGRNYGWPVITYGVNYGTGTKIGEGTHKQGMEQPLHYWSPSIAPSGMAFVTSEHFSEWQGNLLVGALRGQTLVRLELDGEEVVAEERMLTNQVGRIRAVKQGPDGLIYLLTDERNGALLRLEPAD